MKKPLKIVLLVLAAVLLVVISYLAYVLIDYHRLGDMDLEVDRQVSQPAQTGCESVSYTHLTLPTNREV